MSTLRRPTRRLRWLPILIAALALLTLAGHRTALAEPPANDNFADPTAFSSVPYTDSVQIDEATTEVGEPLPCFLVSKSVWYVFTPNSDAVLTVGAVGATNSGNVNVYQEVGTGFAGLIFVGCSGFSGLTFRAKTGQSYYLQAEPTFDQFGSLAVHVDVVSPPGNDNFANATPVTAIPFTGTANLTAATVEQDEPTPSCAQPLQASTWYAFTPSATKSYFLNFFGAEVGVYTGNSVDHLVEVTCRPGVFQANLGTTYYIQLGSPFAQPSSATFTLDVPPPPTANFFWSPSDPSAFDSVAFSSASFDPAFIGIKTFTWDFGDGTTAVGDFQNRGDFQVHHYSSDGDYTAKLGVETFDGRTASIQKVVTVRSHDVAIARLAAPQTARAGQTRTITVSVTNARYAESVQVELSKSTASGFFQPIGTLTQPVPARSGNHATAFHFNYTFTADDASLGKVTFRAIATLLTGRDAFPADNDVTALPTKVSK